MTARRKGEKRKRRHQGKKTANRKSPFQAFEEKRKKKKENAGVSSRLRKGEKKINERLRETERRRENLGSRREEREKERKDYDFIAHHGGNVLRKKSFRSTTCRKEETDADIDHRKRREVPVSLKSKGERMRLAFSQLKGEKEEMQFPSAGKKKKRPKKKCEHLSGEGIHPFSFGQEGGRKKAFAPHAAELKKRKENALSQEKKHRTSPRRARCLRLPKKRRRIDPTTSTRGGKRHHLSIPRRHGLEVAELCIPALINQEKEKKRGISSFPYRRTEKKKG